MSDLFHENLLHPQLGSLVPIFDTMRNTQRHRYIILTKRPLRMKVFIDWYNTLRGGYKFPRDFPNVWLGITAENQAMADERIPILLSIPATLHFVSVEPMLTAVELGLDKYLLGWVICGCESGHGARHFNTNWAAHLRDQCVAANVPFFFKQSRGSNGEFIEMPRLDGVRWAQIPEA